MASEQCYESNLISMVMSVSASVYRDATNSYRKALLSAKLKVPTTVPRILLIDDDPSFGKIMNRAAEFKGLNITYCASVDELGALKSFDFDAIIMDYDLGHVTGFELTEYLESFTKEEVPVILVSQTEQKSSDHWPDTIREFVHKKLGPYAILDAAFEAHEIRQIHRSISRKNSRH